MTANKASVSPQRARLLPTFLAEGGGQCGEAIRRIDWASNPLGPIAQWPRGLQTMLATVLRSRQPMVILWGTEHICLYNDAYMPALGATDHLRGLGCEAAQFWHEIWDVMTLQLQEVMRYGRATWHEDHCISFLRNGRRETSYWTYGYSPIYGDDNGVGGALITCTETTQRVHADRRLRAVQYLSAQFIACRSPKDVLRVVMQTAEAHPEDIAHVSFVRTEQANHVPDAMASERHPQAARASEKPPMLHTTSICASHNQVANGTLTFEIPDHIIVDQVYLDFLQQLTSLSSIAIENIQRRIQDDIFFKSPHRLLCIASTAGYLVRVSPGFVHALGFDSAYLMSVPFIDLIHPDDVAETLSVATNARNQQTVVNFTNRYRCQDGSYRWFSWVSQTKGRLTYCVVHDITDLKQAEAKLVKAIAARDAFLSIASHELKTPITSLKLYSQLVERQYHKQGLAYFTDARIQRVIRMLLVQSDRLGRLVEDMLDISRITAGRLAIQQEHACLTEMIVDVVSRFDLQLKAADCAVVFAVAPDTWAYIDVFRLEQVLSNLLTNAMRYAPSTKVTISLHTDATHAIMRVADGGPGIAPAHRDRIFQRFERFVSPSEVSGLGLGLYISQQIVQAHQGTISLDLSVPNGACFEVRLPFVPPGPPDT